MHKQNKTPHGREKISTNEATDKDIISNIIQIIHAAQYQNQQTNKQPNKKWAKDLNWVISKEDIQMVKKYAKMLSITNY